MQAVGRHLLWPSSSRPESQMSQSSSAWRWSPAQRVWCGGQQVLDMVHDGVEEDPVSVVCQDSSRGVNFAGGGCGGGCGGQGHTSTIVH